jgi:hypothetical protein
MNDFIQLPVFRGLSDSLQVAIAIQNDEAIAAVLLNADAAKQGGAISAEHFEELKADAIEAGYEFV